MPHILHLDKLNELLNTSYSGTNIGYGERGIEFRYIECDSLEDFEENAPFDTCWTNENNITYFKCKDGYNEARTIYLDESGEYQIL